MILLNMSMVACTIAWHLTLTASEKCERKLSRMVMKICALEASESSRRPMTLKCRTNLAVTCCRPPPGGPIEPTRMRSTIFRKPREPVRSYQPPWSNHCLRSSTGGCAPYVSRFGMFKSSTCSNATLPAGGPNTPLRLFSSLVSRVSCVWFADVCAENAIVIGRTLSGIFLPITIASPHMYCEMVTVFPVPVSPTISTCERMLISLPSRKVLQMESAVGTMSSANANFVSIWYGSIVVIHLTHRPA
mmetsp:Transcript_24429/g.96936  ORF Transcript_24429/g.96936 Transcript_24429/m.96936 type:complete len:246 (-) Transcript_24429:4090-4827(-)